MNQPNSSVQSLDDRPVDDRPFNEKERLAELYALKILDTPADKHFDRYTRLVAEILKVPMVAVSLIDADRQWVKSSVGIADSETPRKNSFGHYALQQDLLEIPDTLEDDFFCHHRDVVNSPFIRFYMATVLRGPTGQPPWHPGYHGYRIPLPVPATA